MKTPTPPLSARDYADKPVCADCGHSTAALVLGVCTRYQTNRKGAIAEMCGHRCQTQTPEQRAHDAARLGESETR